MNNYICTKACSIGGEPYKPGDQIKPGAIRAGREGALIRMGLIAIDNRPATDAAANGPVLPTNPNVANPTGDTPEDTTGSVKGVKEGDEQTGEAIESESAKEGDMGRTTTTEKKPSAKKV